MGADVLRKEKLMQLLIKQRVFSWTDTYDVYDEKEEPKYFVKAEFFSTLIIANFQAKSTGFSRIYWHLISQ